MLLLLLPLTLWQADAKESAGFQRWEAAVAALEASDRKNPPSPQSIFFAGSSSIRLWDLKKSFPNLETVNRGFGGSQIADSTHFAPRLLLKHRPQQIVLYAGDNDLAAGKTAAQVADDFRAFAQVIHRSLPQTRIYFLAIKPSPARWKLFEEQKRANSLIKSQCESDARLIFVDVATPMLGPDGKPNPDLFVKDGLHLNEQGYELWRKILQPHLNRKDGTP